MLLSMRGDFTFENYGLVLVEDLGGWWEKETGCPIPLGAIVAKKTLEEDMIASIEAAIRKSLKMARSAPELPITFVLLDMEGRFMSCSSDNEADGGEEWQFGLL